MIEYMLMLLLTVAIIAGLNRALGEPLNGYARNYVSDMVRCIVDTGELPERAFEICGISVTINLNEFTIEKNSDSERTSGFGAVSSSSNANNSQGGGDNDANNNNDTSEDDDDGTDAGNSNRSSRNGIRSRPNSATTALNDSDSGFQPSDEKRSIEAGSLGPESAEEDAFEGFSSAGNGSRRRKRLKAEGIGGSFSLGGDASAAEEEALKPANLNVTRTVKGKNANEDEVPQGPQAFKVEDEKAKRGLARAGEDEGLDFSFGNMLKWLIIIAILVIFLVFMMNQLNSIRKGWTS